MGKLNPRLDNDGESGERSLFIWENGRRRRTINVKRIRRVKKNLQDHIVEENTTNICIIVYL